MAKKKSGGGVLDAARGVLGGAVDTASKLIGQAGEQAAGLANAALETAADAVGSVSPAAGDMIRPGPGTEGPSSSNTAIENAVSTAARENAAVARAEAG